MSNKARIIIFSSIGVIIIIMSYFLFQPLKHFIYQYIKGSGNYVIQGNHNIIDTDATHFPTNSMKEQKPVQFEFRLPHYLLQRKDIIDSILERFNNSAGISTVALAGIIGLGGVGKTTIARMIGKYWEEYYPNSHVYEINAETETTIANSFMDLATALAQTDPLKEKLSYIKQTSDPQQKAKELSHFVRNILKKSPKWLLIFDNVDSKKDIELYFPYDANIWGNGHIIITTRNNNIVEDEFVDAKDITHIDQLSEAEEIELFTTIYSYSNKVLTDNEILQIKQFLKEIPPFPHDINIAARYIRNHNINLSDYLKLMQQQTRKFYESQEEFMKNVSEYSKSRYQIISLSLEQILKKNEKYQELLVLLSLLDSQDIPKELLEFCSDKLTTNNFLYELHRYSLITQGEKYGIPTLSFHRSTFEIVNKYIECSNIKNIIYDNIFNKTRQYFYKIIILDNLLYMKLMLVHIKNLLDKSFITKKFKSELYIIQGIFLCYNGDYKNVKHYLKNGIKNLNHNNKIKAHGNMYLATMYLRTADFKKAKYHIKCASKIFKRLKNFYGLAQTYSYQGLIYFLTDNNKKAKITLFKSIRYANLVDFEIGSARSMLYLGIVNKNLGKYSEAQKIVMQAIHIYQKVDDIHIAWGQSYLSSIMREFGEYEKAMILLQKSLKVFDNHYYRQYKILEWLLADIINIQYNIGDYQSIDVLFRLQKLSERTADSGIILHLGRNLTHMGKLYYKLGQYQKAQEFFLEGKEKQIKGFGEDSLKTAWVNGELAKLYADLGQYQEAKKLVKSSLTIHQAKLPTHHIRIAKQQVILGRICYLQKNYAEAKPLLIEALIRYQDHFGKDHLRTAEILRYLGDLYLAQGNIELAKEFLKHSLKILKDNDNHPDKFLSYESLAALEKHKAEQSQGNNDIKNSHNSWRQAQQYLKQALQIAETTFPPDSAHIARLRGKNLIISEIKLPITIPPYNFLYNINNHLVP